ncbi:MAG: recombinase family protein [Candidatus Wallbacteria bacterium]|nr:recombinase family protein [Candidatus Wallbacteria bacterium]
MNQRIDATHLSRRAIVYPRQSTLRQLVEHRESTVRQYALRERAVALGWAPQQVEVIDWDLGESATSVKNRLGFQRLAEEVAHGRVGAIFALECSLLARCSADWQRLLELCGLADVPLIDEQTIYAPRDPDDRLLLGIKGTLSEAELNWMRLRLQGAILSKARRGELKRNPPVGYEWDARSKRLVMSGDGRIRSAIALVFERFRVEACGSAVARYFFANGLEIPRLTNAGPVRWRLPNSVAIVQILRNPAYAGAYVFGRRLQSKGLVDGEIRTRVTKNVPREQWKVCLPGHHPGYIDWNEYMANQKKLDANRYQHADPQRPGAPRSGDALLQGLLLCGRCGTRMKTQFQSRKNCIRPRYRCAGIDSRRGSAQGCWPVAATRIDQAVVERFLAAVVPAELELSLRVANEVERQTQELNRQWELKLEQSRFDARHAERRYRAVDPDNRVVARTLENDWNDALVRLQELEASWEEEKRIRHLELTDEDRRRIRKLSGDLPRIWSAATTTPEDRKQLLRLLLSEITLDPIEVPTSGTRVRLLWRTGTVDELFVQEDAVARAQTQGRSGRTAEIMDELTRPKRTGLTDGEAAVQLNAAGILTLGRRPWTRKAIERFRFRERRGTGTDNSMGQGKADRAS